MYYKIFTRIIYFSKFMMVNIFKITQCWFHPNEIHLGNCCCEYLSFIVKTTPLTCAIAHRK